MSDSRLPAQIGECGDDVLHTRRRLGALIDELMNCRTADEAQGAIAEMRAVLCGLSATGNRIKAYVAAARMVGMIEPARVGVESLELHPAYVGKSETLKSGKSEMGQRELMLSSLHRAGDHTLDPEGES